ncbi:MAG: glycyl-radical enzyme activating protein, partial [Eubacteriales bacterium]|nr:glycyl-radical enzyme activating protein [Eubacteriales bacterium]
MRLLGEQSRNHYMDAAAANETGGMGMNELKGKVLRIEKTSIHDGEGLRTVVFLKGCPLKCKWCSTPESQYRYSHCATGYGKEMTVSEVVKEVCKDAIFFFHSGGGVTISGGEVLMQSEFAAEILKECRMEGMQTAIETSLYGDYDTKIRPLLPHIQTMYIDFKVYDEEKHRFYTGVSNDLIKNNLQRLQEEFRGYIHIRIPTVPEVNMDTENARKTAEFLKPLPKIKDIELLPYHKLGTDTYRKMDVKYELPEVQTPEMAEMRRMAETIKEADPDRIVKIKGELF